MSSSTGNSFEPTNFQTTVQQKIREGKSILLIAPTGLGKTFAVVGDIQQSFDKVVYAVPLRALGGDIRDSISHFKRNDKPINAVIHHGDLQESMLFSEEVVVTTYDQVVCGVPGLPLSLPLKAGHAVAGALLMSRLILDEVHLAWGISEQALSILLAIVDFRRKLGLQTVILTATMPKEIASMICAELNLELIIAGENDTADDEGLILRETNRQVNLSLLPLKSKGKGEIKTFDYAQLDTELMNLDKKRIYFANTVERIQTTYDRLINAGMASEKIIVLHNRMPLTWRTEVESKVRKFFGKDSVDNNYLLLTNQVAEAGLDISAPLVISDPAPVDTLIQRAGRCARWFREGKTEGRFFVIKVPNIQLKEWAIPYKRYVDATIKTLPVNEKLTWSVEQNWINKAWGIQLNPQGKFPKNPAEKQKEQVEDALNKTTFALNLFDRAAQKHHPGEIASAFREILSVEVAVYNPDDGIDLQKLLTNKQHPETSSVSLNMARRLVRKAANKAKVIHYEDGEPKIEEASFVQTGDTVIIPGEVAHLHRIKGLCIRDGAVDADAILNSEWTSISGKGQTGSYGISHYQTLSDHTKAVMSGTYERISSEGLYRKALTGILQTLEPQQNIEHLIHAISQIAALAAGFHDLGKADRKWQARVREIDPASPKGLIGRTAQQSGRIGIPHTPPGYCACLQACKLIGLPPSANYLISAIALASVRHHSSLLNPSTITYEFTPSPDTVDFIRDILKELNIPEQTESGINSILV